MDLYAQQLRAYDLVVKEKQSVFVTGLAGTGKTSLVHSIYNSLLKEGYEIMCVSFTGKAALNMPGDGTTISRNVGMKRGSADYLPVGYFDRAPYHGVLRKSISTIYKNVDSRWGASKLAVFIDEAGQLSSENARLFLDLGMLKRKDKGLIDLPLFIFTADFGQLAPIKGSCILEPAVYKYMKEAESIEVVSLPSIVDDIQPTFLELTEIVRQSDPTYIRALRWIYYGIALHPNIKERFYCTSPKNVKRIMFNNDEVVAENKRYVENYLKANPNRKVLVYKALYDPYKIGQTALKDLIPVLPEMIVAEGMIFNVTENVPTDEDRRKLKVANGETVEVVTVTSSRGIKVRKSNGELVDLNYVQHSLPLDSNKNKPSFFQLPGYVGHSSTIHRSQGQTFSEPVEFGAWQWVKGKRRSLKQHQGSLYVMLSRNTSLEDLYFDTSFGVEEAIALLKDAIALNKNVQKYVKAPPPLYITDPLMEKIVVELEEVRVENIPGVQTVSFLFRHTRLDVKEDSLYLARYLVGELVGDTEIAPLLFWSLDEETGISTVVEDHSKLDTFPAMDELARTWIYERSGLRPIPTSDSL